MLLAILVVVSRNGAPAHPPHTGDTTAEALPRRRVARAVAVPAPDWPEVPVATSVVELGPALAQPVAEGLTAARTRIARCVAVEQRRAAAAGADPGVVEAAEIVLRLSGRSGALHVVGVEERSPGASPVLADCARRHLDGDTFPAPDAVPGRRHRLLVSVR